MFDRVSDLSDSLTGGSELSDGDTEGLPELLYDDEQLAHVLVNNGGLEHTREGRTTTVEPNGNENTFVLVTDERILYILGDKPKTVEIEVDMRHFKASHVRKGLLSSKLLVKAGDEEVLFNPDDGDMEATEDYIDRVASCWADMEDAIAKSRRTMNEFEAACEAGQATGQRYLNAKSNLSEARRCATRDEDAPTEKIDAAVDEAKRELERRGIEAWLDRAETKHEEIGLALEESRYDDACEAYATAASALDSAQDIVSDTENEYDDLEERIDEVESAIRGAGEEFLDESDAECETALTADETTVAIDAWEEAFDRYSAAVEAGWNGQAPVSADAIELQLTWVTSSLLDALGSHASMFEQDGDECDDDDQAQEYYDEAIEWYERAEEFAVEHPERTQDEFAAAADRVEDKQLDRSGWEFGNA